MQRVRKINYVFLCTVLIMMISSSGLIPFEKIVHTNTQLLIVSQLLIIIPSLVYLITSRIKYKDAVRFKKVRPANVVLIIVFTFLLLPVMTFINALSQLYAVDTTTDVMTSIADNSPFLISLFTVAFIPCLFEESVYRGVIYNEYSRHNKLAAIFLSAFLFGILHGNLNQFTYAFAMGIVFAFVIEATDSIVSTMIIHFIINGNSVVLLYLYPKFIKYLEQMYNSAVASGDSSMITMIENAVGGNNFNVNEIMDSASAAVSDYTLGSVIASYGVIALVCGILAFLVYRTIAINANRWDHVKAIFQREHRDREERFFAKKNFQYFVPLYIGMAICIVSMILNELIVRGIIKA